MTAHIEAKKEDISSTVIMPGDPLRAKFIAETYLENYRLINSVRGMLGYTGTYKGKEVTVMASGMGMPSMGIYSYELFKFYDVDTIIRVGSCGAYTDKLKLYDVILVSAAYSETSFAEEQDGSPDKMLFASIEVNEKIRDVASKINLPIVEGIIHSTDVFYEENNDYEEIYKEYNCIAVEMESFALFHSAYHLNKKAACILTVSDHLVTHEETTSEERETSFTKMIELALESI